MAEIIIKNNIPVLKSTLEKAIAETLSKAGLFLEAKIVEKVSAGNIPPPLLPATIKRKGSSGTLIDTGELLGQITTVQMEEGGTINAVGVGVFGSRAMVGRVHEFGSSSKNIPERSFLRSTLNDQKGNIKELVADELKKKIEETVI